MHKNIDQYSTTLDRSIYVIFQVPTENNLPLPGDENTVIDWSQPVGTALLREDATRITRMLNDRFEQGGLVKFELWFIGSDGAILPVDEHGKVLHDNPYGEADDEEEN